jgi:hypothetical protein
MLEFLVGCGGGNEETSLVACSEAADNAGSCNCGMANGYDVLEFGFEDTARRSVLYYVVAAPAPKLLWKVARTGGKYAHL